MAMARLAMDRSIEETHGVHQSPSVREGEAGSGSSDPTDSRWMHLGLIAHRWLCFTLLAAALETYGFRNGLIVALGFWTLLFVVALLGVIPVLGSIAYWWIARSWIVPHFFAWFSSIHPSWVTEGYVWLGVLTSLIFSQAVISGLQEGRRKHRSRIARATRQMDGEDG